MCCIRKTWPPCTIPPLDELEGRINMCICWPSCCFACVSAVHGEIWPPLLSSCAYACVVTMQQKSRRRWLWLSSVNGSDKATAEQVFGGIAIAFKGTSTTLLYSYCFPSLPPCIASAPRLDQTISSSQTRLLSCQSMAWGCLWQW